MSTKWHKSQFPGVRYREHPLRKHNGRYDRYFTIRYKIEGKLKEEGLGWSAEGWNAQKASLLRSELRKNLKTGEGPATLAEKRLLAERIKEADERHAEMIAMENIPFRQFFIDNYYLHAKSNITKKSYLREESLFRLWIDLVIGHLPFREVSLSHLDQIKNDMMSAGRSPRSINYAIAVIGRTFNYAKHHDVYTGSSPVEKFKMLKFDNQRRRFLTREEARVLLNELRKRSLQLYELSLVSLRTGARANEIFSLHWGDVDLERGTLTLWDTKNTKTRIAYITEDVKQLLKAKTGGTRNELVFPGRGGVKINDISNAFNRAVDAVEMNEGITDRRERLVFHSLRHTYASWLVEKGVDLYTVKELMGHSTIAMTERYSHLGPNTLQNAVKKLEEHDISGDNAD